MHAFFAALWDDHDADACAQAEILASRINRSGQASPVRLKLPGLIVCDLACAPAGDACVLVPGAADAPGGIFVGTLFRRTPESGASAPVAGFSRSAAERIRQTAGRCVMSEYWGNYVGFVRDGTGTAVLASPTSAIACFYMRRGGLTHVFSHLEKCPFLDTGGLSLNIGFVSALLAYDKIQNGETGFTEIRELLGGERLLVTQAGAVTEQIWNPGEIAKDVHLPPVHAAAAELRETTRYVVRSWASAFGEVAVNLSGGLDSSIVLSCLGRGARAVHHRLVSDDPPELQYARAAASWLDCPLTEVPVRPDAAFPAIDDHPLSVRPYRQFLDPDLEALFGPHIEGRIDAFFTGQGGDHLFVVRRTALGFADYLRNEGLGSDLAAELLQSARLSGKSIWSVLKETVGAGRRRPSAMVRAIERRIARLPRPIPTLPEPAGLVPSWAREKSGLPPAKFDQVSQLVHLFQERETLDRPFSRQFVHPLVSQPLIELCLRIPIYRLCAQGQNRGLARIAFDGAIPDLIRHRMTKGESTRFFVDQVTRNRRRIADALFGGELAALGLIAREDIDALLATDRHETGRFGHALLVYYTIEAWLRRWRGHLGRSVPTG